MTTYRDSGVDIDAQDAALGRISEHVRATFTKGVLSDIGSFGGLFRVPFSSYRDPLLVSSADGVGTKLRLAFLTDRHDTVGQDLVHHCINDILVQGAEPLFFLDYLSTGRLRPEVVEQVVGGVAAACKRHGIALLGGETAEMPGFYGDGEYDLAGFIVGVVDRRKLLGADKVCEGDILVGLPASGLHTNGYSLARKIILGRQKLTVTDHIDELGCTVGDELLKVHRCYHNELAPLVAANQIHALAHITGGGISDNLPRVLPAELGAVVKVGSWEIPPIFGYLASCGEIPEEDLWRTFNMGVGMILVVAPDCIERVLRELRERRCTGFPMGNIIAGKRGVAYDHPPNGYPTGLR